MFYCAKSRGSDPGFCAWGVVTEFYEDAEMLYFIRQGQPTIMMTPWWDEEAERLADRIRGKMKQATLWRVGAERDELRDGIRRWLGGTRAE